MNATQEIATKRAGNPAAFPDASAQLEQREKTRALFRNKYDTMLHLTEFIVSLQLSGTRNRTQQRDLEALKFLIDKTRKEL